MVLLVGQDVRCRSLRRKEAADISGLTCLKTAISVAHLRDSTANHQPGFLLQKQEVVAQKHGVFFFISSEKGEELLQTKQKPKG